MENNGLNLVAKALRFCLIRNIRHNYTLHILPFGYCSILFSTKTYNLRAIELYHQWKIFEISESEPN